MSYTMANSEFANSHIPSNIPTDKNDRPIREGDTLKIYHFRGARRKQYYMYKYVNKVVAISVFPSSPDDVARSNVYYEVDHLDENRETYLMPFDGKKHADIEIVQGWFGNQSFEERDKILDNDNPPCYRIS